MFINSIFVRILKIGEFGLYPKWVRDTVDFHRGEVQSIPEKASMV